MKNNEVQNQLTKLGRQFVAVKKAKPAALLEGIVGAMEPIGGITGFSVKADYGMTVHNHTDSYSLPGKFEAYNPKGLSSKGKKTVTIH